VIDWIEGRSKLFAAGDEDEWLVKKLEDLRLAMRDDGSSGSGGSGGASSEAGQAAATDDSTQQVREAFLPGATTATIIGRGGGVFCLVLRLESHPDV
jgi:hypothetical protein